jgi:hypothetical protein
MLFSEVESEDIRDVLRACEAWRYRDMAELIDLWLFKSTCPAVCRSCGHIELKECDVLSGWCGLCDSDTMRSVMVLAGVL